MHTPLQTVQRLLHTIDNIGQSHFNTSADSFMHQLSH